MWQGTRPKDHTTEYNTIHKETFPYPCIGIPLCWQRVMRGEQGKQVRTHAA